MADIALIMGSISDWDTMKQAAAILDSFGVTYTKEVISAHRTPGLMAAFAGAAREKGYKIIIAGAGGAAHLPGMTAAYTSLPVIGVPIQSRAMNGLDSLYSIVQMPAGVPVATMAIGESGAKNAALYAVQILAIYDENLQAKLSDYRKEAERQVLKSTERLDG